MHPRFEATAHTRAEAHAAATSAYRAARAMTETGISVRIVVEEASTSFELARMRHYWGVVLTNIALQARMFGRRASKQEWHDHLREFFLGYDFFIDNEGQMQKRLISTRKLTSARRSDYLMRVEAYAVVDLDVVIPDNPDDIVC